jgi:hypothetical protein
MNRTSDNWSFDRELQKLVKDLRGYRSYQATRAFLAEKFNERPYNTYVDSAAQLLTDCARYRVAGFALAAASNSPLAGPLLHVYWRDSAFAWYVYLEKCRQLAEEATLAQRKVPVRLPIVKIEMTYFTNIVITMALGIVIGEDEIAKWFGERCVEMMVTIPPYCDPRAWQVGPMQGFLMQLYMHWSGSVVDVNRFGFAKLKPFQTILDAWHDERSVEEATLRILRIHARKALRPLDDDNDLILGMNNSLGCIFPLEILFLQRVRRDLGLSVPNPEHPLLRSPAVMIPLPCERSGYDELLALLYAHCRTLEPDLRVPWEEEFQAAGPDDPKRVPVIEADMFGGKGKKRSR